MTKALPKFNTPEYSLSLPISGKNVRFRAYNVADERVLIAASESKDADSKFYAENMLKVISGVVLNDVDPSKLPAVEARLLMLHVRSKSVGEIIEVKLEDQPISIDIRKIFIDGVRAPEDYKIQLDDEFGLLMKEISFEDEVFASAGAEKEGKGSTIYKLLISSIDSIYTKDEMWKVGVDIETKDVEAFIDDIPSGISEKIYKFVANMPVLAVQVEIDGESRVITNREVDFLS